MRVSDGTHTARFDRWGLEGEMIELAVLRGTIAGRTRYVSLVTLDFVARYLEEDQGDPPLDSRYVRRLATQLLSDGMVGALVVSFSPSGVFVGLGGDDGSLGVLRLARSTELRIADGRHRQAAIRRALADDPRLADETIALELFAHDGPPRRRQRPAATSPADAPGEDHTSTAARLAAINMALNGHSRAEVGDYLTVQFNVHADDELLDEVFTEIEGPQVS
jgi:DNA-sulfur modification-associated